jgi:hypothetical protein
MKTGARNPTAGAFSLKHQLKVGMQVSAHQLVIVLPGKKGIEPFHDGLESKDNLLILIAPIKITNATYW